MKPSTWQDSAPQTLDCQPGALTAVLQRMPMKKNTFAKKDEPGFEQMKKINFLAKKSAII